MGNFCEWMLESSLLVLMILGIRRIFAGRIRYAGIYALWIVVLLRFAVPVSLFSTPISVGNLLSEAAGLVQEREGTEAAATQISGLVPSKPEEVSGSLPDGQGGEVLSNGQQPAALESGAYRGAVAGGANVVGKSKVSRLLQGEGRFFPFFLNTGRWVVSGALFIWILLSNLCLLHRIKRDRVFYGNRGRISIYKVPHVSSPCLYGFFRPAVYLPEMSAAGGDEADLRGRELEQIITHECVHYRHGDHIWSMLCMVLVSVYWYDPFLWLAVSYFKKDAELFCDETVIGILGEENRFRYGRLLVKMAGETCWGDFRYSMLSMSRRGKEIKGRIRAISRKRPYSRWLAVPLVLAVILTLGITCSTGAGFFAGKSSDHTAEAEKKEGVPAGGMLPVDMSCFPYPGLTVEKEKQDSLKPAVSEGEKLSTLYAAPCGEAFDRYMQIFTQAVNTGKTDQMDQVLAVGSEVYEQQCALVKNYHRRGIREEVISYSVTEVNALPAYTGEDGVVSPRAEIQSKEKIRVYYGDGVTKVIKQKYLYTCTATSAGWIITAMGEVPQKS